MSIYQFEMTEDGRRAIVTQDSRVIGNIFNDLSEGMVFEQDSRLHGEPLPAFGPVFWDEFTEWLKTILKGT